MKNLLFTLLVTLAFTISVNAQTTPTTTSTPKTTVEEKPKKQIFRANKEQIMQAQKMLKVTETGKLDDETRAAIKTYQPANGLKATGTLNRATLEKMGIALTDKQKEMPVSENSFASADSKKSDDSPKPKKVIFRASKEQIMQAQKMLKDKGMYAGEQTGKLDDATREGLKKYQSANSLKDTGTLNQATLEKMGIALTDKQKENAMKNSQ
jgi:peptidoglycan hydrolase-like protein with peptidoglycan-binding domain